MIHWRLPAVAAIGVAALFAHDSNVVSYKNSNYSFLAKPPEFSYTTSVNEFKYHLPQNYLSKLSRLDSISNISISLQKLNHSEILNQLFSRRSYTPTNPSNHCVIDAAHHSFYPLFRSYQHSEAHNLSTSQPEALYRWHLPRMNSSKDVTDSGCLAEKSQTLIVLLGWLGAKQRHLQRYADWYTTQGFNVLTFTFPMSHILSYRVGARVEQDVLLLANHLSNWLGQEHEKKLVFHAFSNTGWLTYGVILENFLKEDTSLTEKIKGCIVDSAPAASPDPQVWALGFSAALLKKQSFVTKKCSSNFGSQRETIDALGGSNVFMDLKPALLEAVLLTILEKLFEIVLNFPSVSRRLSEVLSLLIEKQPKCPQLYVYSSADRVIPAKSIELFVEKQRRAGHEVRAYNFITSPHVDHFRNSPELYISQVTAFLEEYVLTCKGDSSTK